MPPAHPFVKTGTWSCTGEQSALAVPHGPPMVPVGLKGAHTCSGRYSRYSCELLARAPGDCTALARCACLVHRCPGSPGARDHSVAAKKLYFCFTCILLQWNLFKMQVAALHQAVTTVEHTKTMKNCQNVM